eukprot:CAMPEP_0176224682 /NCGR_PEP_ID=MMETSP0121_2-20121125/21378_1 /TAXON_ID=160619 /ORGANISM="Kryptoperidinium foliaceum, Strain CCMP 1326" /LENGTH=400 /DNA_ID=CAMNT_0017563939 /DNA_START=8 /DNA_END=1207 /DNA_ORIENTATION=+
MTGKDMSGKKPGPNDKCTCGSGAKAKKCCFGAAASATSSLSEPGHVLPGSVDELWSMGKEALQAGDDKKALHHLTMAVNSAAKKMPRNKDGIATDADLAACNKETEGKLAALLSERSSLYLRTGDHAAAIEDAETCTRADPSYEKGHLRLAVAYEAAGAALQLQLEACERGVAACPSSEVLVARKWRLKKAIAEQPQGAGKAAGDAGDRDESALEAARRLADDVADPRRAMAAADWGSILATGAHGVTKDFVEAEKYLRIGSDGGDISAQRNLGFLLLQLERPGEAALELSKAAEAGDEQAVEVLAQLAKEAEAKQAALREKLEELAQDGDERARQMLSELDGSIEETEPCGALGVGQASIALALRRNAACANHTGGGPGAAAVPVWEATAGGEAAEAAA